ncbi:hypothetical protein PQ478_08305 [Alkalihalophilus pseudofirmus]|uniref:hypothetical protein n=1 Tax=Alkalihalophilus pseudofirmus TaxID=79885 RepID=UPI00259B41B3|nr:hypothetical protein [Alkalihalophilus pseudofirmus]WEG18470.1 hypothetical protein PQ478_08305 [Alkalihalophilus pseudofirmus]
MSHKQTFNQYKSPVRYYPFIWLGEYADGSFIPEFNFDNHKENWFREIKKNELIKFGMMGYGHHLYYTVFNGAFNILGNEIEFAFKSDTSEKVYKLSSNNSTKYNDCISYKDVESIVNPRRMKTISTSVYQFNFGYKTKVDTAEVSFNFKPIVAISMEKKPMTFNIRLVSDKDISGEIYVIKNGKVVQTTKATLKANVSGETSWVYK